MLEKYKQIQLKDGRKGIITDYFGSDYIVDIGSSPEDWDTILVKPEEIEENSIVE